MKKFIASKSEKEILKTYPIPSNVQGWFFKIEETSQASFIVDAMNVFGRIFSKRGSDPTILQREIENELCKFPPLR
jgi:hypothetical protein